DDTSGPVFLWARQRVAVVALWSRTVCPGDPALSIVKPRRHKGIVRPMRLSTRLSAAPAALVVALGLTAALPAEAQSRRAAAPVAAADLTRAAPATPRAVTFAAAPAAPSGTLVLPLSAAGDLDARAATLSAETRAALAAGLKAADFGYGQRKSVNLYGLGGWDRVLVVGLAADASAADI